MQSKKSPYPTETMRNTPITTAAKFGQTGQLSVYFGQAQSQGAAQCDKPNDDKLHHLSFETNGDDKLHHLSFETNGAESLGQ
jgi:hypothetical protein